MSDFNEMREELLKRVREDFEQDFAHLERGDLSDLELRVTAQQKVIDKTCEELLGALNGVEGTGKTYAPKDVVIVFTNSLGHVTHRIHDGKCERLDEPGSVEVEPKMAPPLGKLTMMLSLDAPALNLDRRELPSRYLCKLRKSKGERKRGKRNPREYWGNK